MNTYKYGSNGRNRIGGTKNELRKMMELMYGLTWKYE